MNDTNRFLNRTFLLILGLVLTVLGAAAGALVFVPRWAELWRTAGENATTAVSDALTATPMPGTEHSWLLLLAVVVLAVVIVGMIALLASVGGGRSARVYGGPSATADARSDQLVVETSFAAEALRHSLDKRTDLVSSAVNAYTVRTRPVLHVSVTPRQNTSPKLLADQVSGLLAALARVVGDEPASCITIHSGILSKVAHEQRVD